MPQLLIIFLIVFLPIISNFIYGFVFSNLEVSYLQRSDVFSYLMNVEYKYPNIPPERTINIYVIDPVGTLSLSNKYRKTDIPFNELNLDDIPPDFRSNIISTEKYVINFKKNTCDNIVDSYSISNKIFAGQSEQLSNILFPSYSQNFFQVKINNYSDQEVMDFVKSHCNIPTDYPYFINFSNTYNFIP